METVIIIDECNHGTIGVTKTMKGAMNFLIKENWISEYTNVWVEEEDNYDMVINVFGENWEEKLLNFSTEDMEEYFGDDFTFTEVEIWE